MKVSREAAIKPLNNFLNDFAAYENMLNEVNTFEIPIIDKKVIEDAQNKLAGVEADKLPDIKKLKEQVEAATKRIDEFETMKLPQIAPLFDLVAQEKTKHEDRKKVIDTAKYANIDTITDSYVKMSRPWQEIFDVDLPGVKKPDKNPPMVVDDMPAKQANQGSPKKKKKEEDKKPEAAKEEEGGEIIRKSLLGSNPFAHSFCDNILKLKELVQAKNDGEIDAQIFNIMASHYIMRAMGALSEAYAPNKSSEVIYALDGNPRTKMNTLIDKRALDAVDKIRNAFMHNICEDEDPRVSRVAQDLVATFDPLATKIIEDCNVTNTPTNFEESDAVVKLLPERPFKSLEPQERRVLVGKYLNQIKAISESERLPLEDKKICVIRLACMVGEILRNNSHTSLDSDYYQDFVKFRDASGHAFGDKDEARSSEMYEVEGGNELRFNHQYYAKGNKSFAGPDRDKSMLPCDEPIHDDLVLGLMANIDLIIADFERSKPKMAKRASAKALGGRDEDDRNRELNK